MAESQGRWLVTVPLSESFGTVIATMAAELGLEVAEIAATSTRLPEGAVGVVILAGGEEARAVELLEAMPFAVPRWVIGAELDHRVAASIVKCGATDYFALPGDLDLMRRTLARAVAREDAHDGAAQFAAEERDSIGFGAIIGRSVALVEVLDQARRIAAHPDITVLIGGETGTGKELLARAIHYHSPRAASPFVEINCAAIPSALLESELFGHEKGAFTGATDAKPGLFELAEGGTVFLDEIGNLPLELQAKLLRVLESRTLRRVGGRETRPVNVRVISATHVDLAEAVAARAFREDLYYRLNVVRVVLPPLRDRGADIELLAETFTAQLASASGQAIPPLSNETRQALRAHAWPGNVRELRNVIERALVLSPPGVLLLPPFPAPRAQPTGTGTAQAGPLPFPATLHDIQSAAVHAMLAACQGNKSEAARRLGISRPRLQRLLEGASE